jgi:4-oxalomesaconate tautomerase
MVVIVVEHRSGRCLQWGPMSDGVQAMLMRGGTSKGLFFLHSDLPAPGPARDQLLVRIMGSPDPRQIDGIGSAHPLTSKVAVVSPSQRPEAEVDYLFLQLGVETDLVTDQQNCGNILAGVAGFAVERGLVAATGETTDVKIYLCTTDGVATARIQTPGGKPRYDGPSAISGVPGTAAPVHLFFEGIAGSSCGALLPTGSVCDTFTVLDGRPVRATCVDNGMPTVVMLGSDLGITGRETPAELEANERLRADLEAIRLVAGPAMGLGDVAGATVPKMTMVSPPVAGGTVSTRTFIPHRCHDAIGVLGAVSVATACLMAGSPAAEVSARPEPGGPMVIEHPTGEFDCVFDFDNDGRIVKAGVLRTARKLFDGLVFPREEF